MWSYFRWEYENDPFILFSMEHILTLLTIGLCGLLIYFFRRLLRTPFYNKLFRYSLAGLLVLAEASLQSWFLYYDAWSVSYSLPLHLSSISLFLAVIMLLTKNKLAFEFTYFAGLGSAIQAMLTPDLDIYSFPHFRYIHFFISHGGVAIACLFMILAERFKPTLRSLWRSFAALNAYTAFIFIVNKIVDGNYMFIMRKPHNPSILDFLGPWPWYILVLEGIALVSFFILLLPFLIRRRVKN
ncbi:TIGR02206 family membrane protein [Pseudalkalibacillus caeni]|uniref:TIGR02206 family membrane protein n=1 Tax=Exobacillus caeni TaxID=2574798 RepID=A0A5R9F023_9BACL|nr:TIGR02206 family membrane protein [Pseudalkalibacillus caeni]TLS35750.1 TIGR02206 family membrane protein [Pseudalkalibacillus caeni]